MKRLWTGALFICGLAPLAMAQRGGAFPAAGMGGRGFGRPPVTGAIGAGRRGAGTWRFAANRWGYSNQGQFGGAWGYSSGGFDTDANEPAPIVLLLPMQPPEPPPPPPPPEPPKPVMHTYAWPDTDAASATTFLVFAKDGSARPAIAVWVQAGELRYTAPDGVSGRMGIDAIDREATVRVNAERGLRFWLPGRP